MSTTQISSPKKGFRALVTSDGFKAQITAALPKHITADRFVRVLLTASIRTPKIMECTQESVFKAIYDCAAMGLEPDGRRAHLIPYGTVCTLILDYKGIAELVMRSGLVSSIHADTVHEKDQFEVDRGKILKHKVDYTQPRGKAFAAYCLITMKDGGEKAEVMTEEEINCIRSRSRAGKSGPWETDTLEMWKKTVAKRAFKWVPLSPEIRESIEREDDLAPINVTPKVSMSELLGSSIEGVSDDLSTTTAPEATQ